MSLINDALKRAQEAQRKDSPAYIVSPMKPNAPAPAPARMPMPRPKQRNLSWFMPVVIVLLVLVAVFFMVMAMAKRTVKTIVTAPEIATPSQVETVAAPAPNPPAPVVTAAPEPPPEVIGPAAISTDVPKPVIILQGVVNDPKHPWAIVNGQTVYLGDNVEGMRVTVISRSSITLTGNGQTNIVYVGQ